MFGGSVVRSALHCHALFAMMLINRILINRRRCDRKPAPWAHGRCRRYLGETDPGIAAADGAVAGEVRGAGGSGSDVLRGDRAGERNPSVKQLAKIAAALDVPIATLFTEESAGE